MLISRNREKQINAVVYFATNTQHCGKVKLFKLLYLLDFAHFRQTGRSVTGLDYRAWKMGPVPLELMQKWDQLENDMAKRSRLFRLVTTLARQTLHNLERKRHEPTSEFHMPALEVGKAR